MIKIKKIQLGKGADLEKLKAKLAGEKEPKKEKEKEPPKETPKKAASEEEKPRRIRAKSKSAFEPAEKSSEKIETPSSKEEEIVQEEKVSALPLEEAVIAPEPIEIPLPKEEPARVEPPKPESAVQPETKAAPGAPAKRLEPEEEPGKKKVKEFRDIKPKLDKAKPSLARGDDDRWRKKRPGKKGPSPLVEEVSTKPTSITIRLPISIKDLAEKMKRKTSELIQKLFLQGITLTLNDIVDDETLVQFLGSELTCEIIIDRTLVDKIQVVKESVQVEIAQTKSEELILRPPVVTFMGHVDHGKTSLIDAIRKSNVAAQEAGAITQHIGAFRCKTAVGDITILDTPGHEAFSSMRARGAKVTDIVVLVVAGDEGMRDQTFEAIEHAKQAGVTILVAINKCDKPNFNAETVYRQLSEADLLPETWGGQTITVNTSAVNGQGIKELLEMLALQAEVLELKANPNTRARGIVLESELHKGMGARATVLVQNGTLKLGDAFVLDHLFGRVKTMHDEHGKKLEVAGPSSPVEITGLSGMPKAGDPFVVVKSEKEAREISEMRASDHRAQVLQQKKAPVLDQLKAETEKKEKKSWKVVLRADVQGSMEALKNSLLKIKSKKVDVDIIFSGIGEISESDVELAAASSAPIIGFHTAIESMASLLAKERGVQIRLHDIIYHAIDDAKELMRAILDKIPEEKEVGRAEVKALFKMAGIGNVAGCMVIDGAIVRNNLIKLERKGEEIWRGTIASLKRIKEDVKEVKKGFECGILLNGNPPVEEGDHIVALEVTYLTPEL